jgi:hypothetical protein
MQWTELHEGSSDDNEQPIDWRWHRHARHHDVRRVVREWPGGGMGFYMIGAREVTVTEFYAYVAS